MTSNEKRLQKELLAMTTDPPAGVSVDAETSPAEWIIDIEGAPNTLYEGERFQLSFIFTYRYPFDPPQVVFIGPNIPVHPQVYSNGRICLSTLTEDWSPALSVHSLCLSIVTMLSSCTEKVSSLNSCQGRGMRYAVSEGSTLKIQKNFTKAITSA